MLYCQFGNCQGIRDISFGLRSATGNLSHLGVSRTPSKSSISYINAHRGWTFFRLVKQNLKIKSFIGTSENTVLIQIWSALITILLLSVLKTKALYKWHMSNMVGFIRLNLFVKIDLFEWLNHPFFQDKAPPGQMQLDLF